MKVLVTGVTGQDGSIAAQKLTEQGHEVYGLVRSQRVTSIPQGMLVRGDLVDGGSIARIVRELQPDEIYNFGGYSHAGLSFHQPELVHQVNAVGPLHIFEAVRQFSPHSRVFQASSSEMFGNGPMPADEQTPFSPVNPYGVAKLCAHQSAQMYREMGVWVTCAISFNHVSPMHGRQFLPSKIASVAAAIAAGNERKIYLGSLEPRRDWGWAEEYVDGIMAMMRQEQPDNYVLATGLSCAVEEMAVAIFEGFGLNFWEYYEPSPEEVRPLEIRYLLGNPRKAYEQLGWVAHTTWEGVAVKMVDFYRAKVEV